MGHELTKLSSLPLTKMLIPQAAITIGNMAGTVCIEALYSLATTGRISLGIDQDLGSSRG